jgi:hypothetical protein
MGIQAFLSGKCHDRQSVAVVLASAGRAGRQPGSASSVGRALNMAHGHVAAQGEG